MVTFLKTVFKKHHLFFYKIITTNTLNVYSLYRGKKKCFLINESHYCVYFLKGINIHFAAGKVFV